MKLKSFDIFSLPAFLLPQINLEKLNLKWISVLAMTIKMTGKKKEQQQHNFTIIQAGSKSLIKTTNYINNHDKNSC